MSTRRQRNHYIPRVLLNRFASRRQRVKAWIWQTSRDGRAREVSTKDAAVGPLFYGRTGVEDGLRRIESRIGEVLRRIDVGEPLSDFHADLRQFVYLLRQAELSTENLG